MKTSRKGVYSPKTSRKGAKAQRTPRKKKRFWYVSIACSYQDSYAPLRSLRENLRANCAAGAGEIKKERK